MIPAKPHKYTPDFKIRDGVYIETKGFLDKKDRVKLEMVKKQHPNIEILILFQKATNPIYHGSKTTYGDWATEQGFKWAQGPDIPLEWLAYGYKK